MQLPGLNRDQSVAFVYEVNATRNTLAFATRFVSTDALTDNTRDPIMSLIAPGLERLYKLTLGVIAVDRGEPWGDGKSYGHQIGKMHPKIVVEIEQRSSARPYLQDLLGAVRADPVLPAVIGCADAYGREGRYFYLDTLAGNSTRVASPHKAWRTVEDVVTKHHQLSGPVAPVASGPDNAENRLAFTTARGAVISRSITDLWQLIADCGVQGVFGKLGRIYGRDVRPAAVGRQ